MNDATSFLLAFGSVFAGIAYYLVWLERKAKALEARLATLAARAAVLEAQPERPAAKANNPQAPPQAKP